MHKRPKPEAEKPSGRNAARPVSSNLSPSAAGHTQTSKAGEHRPQQQQASPPIRYVPVPAVRHAKAPNARQLHPAEGDRNKARQDVGRRKQNEVKGHEHLHDRRRNKSGSSGDQGNKKDGVDTDADDAVKQSDVDENKVDGIHAAETSSSSSSGEIDATKFFSQSVRWIGSAPLSDRQQGKQRLDAIIELAGKLSAAVESLGRVSFLRSEKNLYRICFHAKLLSVNFYY